MHVNKVLLNITKSMKYPDSCTFTFAGYHNPMAQHLYKCTVCNQTVCLVCSYKCHKTTPWRHSVEHTHELVYVGRVEGYCGCHKVRVCGWWSWPGEGLGACEWSAVTDTTTCGVHLGAQDTCRALASVDRREAEGYKYVPKPIVSALPLRPAGSAGHSVAASRAPSFRSHVSGQGIGANIHTAAEAVAKRLYDKSRQRSDPVFIVHACDNTPVLKQKLRAPYDTIDVDVAEQLSSHVAANLGAMYASCV